MKDMVNIYNRNNVPCNYCKYCRINDDFMYVCTLRKHKYINALNPDLDTHWLVSDKQVLNCKCYSLIDEKVD